MSKSSLTCTTIPLAVRQDIWKHIKSKHTEFKILHISVKANGEYVWMVRLPSNKVEQGCYQPKPTIK